MRVRHFSPKPNLTEVNPDFMGSSGVGGAQYKRGLPEHRTSFFYTQESSPEEMVTSRSPHEYEADLSSHNIYDLDEDSGNYIGEMKKRNQGAWNEDVLHSIIKEKGHGGVVWSQRPGTRVVQTYGKTPVKRVQKIEKGAAGNWKDEGYSFDISTSYDNKDLIIHAIHPKHGEAGRYVFQKDGKKLKVGEALTLKDHQRKGLASEAYKMAENHFGMKLEPTQEEQTPKAKALWSQPNRPFGKNELQKGVKQRLFSVKEENEKKRLAEKPVYDSLFEWQKYAEPEHRTILAEGLGELSPNVKKRALIGLSAKTHTRKNPQTGEIEYLLHRGVNYKERSQAFDEPSGYTAHGAHSSWTPDFDTARIFSVKKNNSLSPNKGGIASAWIPESAIATIPKHFGHYDFSKKGKNKYADEHEVIVHPGNYELVQNKEIKNKLGRDKRLGGDRPGVYTVDQAINTRAKILPHDTAARQDITATIGNELRSRKKLAASELWKGDNRYYEDPLEKINPVKGFLASQAILGGMAVADSIPKTQSQKPAVVSSAQQIEPAQESSHHEQRDHFSDKMLRTIAQVESSGGKNTSHAKLPEESIHVGTRAFGHYGLTPVLVKETLRLNPELARKYPKINAADLREVNLFLAKKPDAQHEVARAHLERLRSHFGDDPAKIGHAWLNGIVGTKKALNEGKDIQNHWHVKKILGAYASSDDIEKTDLAKMSRPRITFPNIPKTSTRPDQEVQLIENQRQKDLYGRKVAQAVYPDTTGRRLNRDGSVEENAKINFQARRDAKAKSTGRMFGTSALGVSSRTRNLSRDPISGALAGHLRSKFEEGDDEYSQKLEEHRQQRNQIIKDYNDQYNQWYKTAYALALSNKINEPGGKEAYSDHISKKPQKPKLPRKPSKPRIKTADLSPKAMAARGRAVDSTIEHEGIHHVLGQIQRHHGEKARVKAVEGLLNAFHVDALTAMLDYTKKLGYKIKSPTFGEEMIANSRDLLVNPAKRQRFEKIYGKEKADQIIKHLKQGHQKAHEWAKNVKLEELGVEQTQVQPKKLAASELSPSHKELMKTLLQKDRGNIKFPNFKKIPTRIDQEIQPVDTDRQKKIFSKKIAQLVPDKNYRKDVEGQVDGFFKQNYGKEKDKSTASAFNQKHKTNFLQEKFAPKGAVISFDNMVGAGNIESENATPTGRRREHEAIHLLFNHFGKLYGEGVKKDLYQKANELIHPSVKQSMAAYLSAIGYHTDSHISEYIPHLYEALHDPDFRDRMNKMGIHFNSEQAKKSWRNVIQWAKNLKPENIG